MDAGTAIALATTFGSGALIPLGRSAVNIYALRGAPPETRPAIIRALSHLHRRSDSPRGSEGDGRRLPE